MPHILSAGTVHDEYSFPVANRKFHLSKYVVSVSLEA